MPIYEYECEDCHEIFEVSQSLSEEPLSSCESCQGPLKKLISMSSFHLKGGGWYADGYSNANASSCKSAAACPAKESSSKSSAPASCPKAEGAPCCA